MIKAFPIKKPEQTEATEAVFQNPLSHRQFTGEANMETRRQVLSMLFSDIWGYSQLKNNDLYVKIQAFNQEFKRQFLNAENHCFCNTWGDAFFITNFRK